ncbi:MAG: SMI1/KNR4 family protein [Pseudopedobacter saltans]|uniref:SMI1/KNR4 family protein n=1 Tax=Pseudopedobacter saltans TaxID=151895 RepID=A0A2W5GR12_9SPHI|nr:MAG: SMI1/KNR4 family protein [Pseudopedobacter saltans]
MKEQLERIKNKIEQLKQLDQNLTLFGSNKHKYNLNPTLSDENVQNFEAVHKIILPNDYKDFLTKIGNGGVGPYYGLEPIENSLFDDLDYKRSNSLLNPSQPFPHTSPWNIEFVSTVNADDDEEEYERQYFEFSKNLMNGVLAISNFGCGVSINLVVNGEEYGNIWTDDRGNEGGIYPSHELGNKEKITFLNWYELWLDNSLNEIKEKHKSN